MGSSRAQGQRRDGDRPLADPGQPVVRTPPGAIKHAILLTDGKDDTRPRQLAAAIRPASASSADCRGIGVDWRSRSCARSPRRCSAPSTSSRPGLAGRGLPGDDGNAMGRRSPTSRCGCGCRRAPRPLRQAGRPGLDDLTGRGVAGQPSDRLPDRRLGRRSPATTTSPSGCAGRSRARRSWPAAQLSPARRRAAPSARA